jgi:hypothetical protein
MSHQQNEGPGTETQDDLLGIPAFLKREPGVSKPAPKQELPMRTDDEATAPADTEAPADKAKPAKAAKPRKAKPASANGKAADKANGNAATPTKAKAAKPLKAAAKPAKAKAVKAKAQRQRDPAKLDQFGFRKGSIKSTVAAMYAKGKGATLAEVKESVGSIQFNLLTELKGRGFKVEQAEVKSPAGRLVTRYKLHAQAA